LPDEVHSLAALEANSERVAKYLRRSRGAVPDKSRIAVTLDSGLVAQMNAACEAKGIVRDAFLERFIQFLVLGDDEYNSCISPLIKAAELLNNPRHEYAWNHHPYEDLIMTDGELDAAQRLPKDLSRLLEEPAND